MSSSLFPHQRQSLHVNAFVVGRLLMSNFKRIYDVLHVQQQKLFYLALYMLLIIGISTPSSSAKLDDNISDGIVSRSQRLVKPSVCQRTVKCLIPKTSERSGAETVRQLKVVTCFFLLQSLW